MQMLKRFAKFQFAELNIKETPEKTFSSLEFLLYGYRSLKPCVFYLKVRICLYQGVQLKEQQCQVQ